MPRQTPDVWAPAVMGFLLAIGAPVVSADDGALDDADLERIFELEDRSFRGDRLDTILDRLDRRDFDRRDARDLDRLIDFTERSLSRGDLDRRDRDDLERLLDRLERARDRARDDRRGDFDDLFGRRTLTGEFQDRVIRNRDIREALIERSRLFDVDVSEATITDSRHNVGSVDRATLRDSTFLDIDGREVEAFDSRIDGGRWDAVTLRGSTISDVDLTDALVVGGSIRDSRLERVTLEDVTLGPGVELCQVFLKDENRNVNDDC